MASMITACNRIELYGNLGEEDANEILVLLQDTDVRAQKKKDVRQNEVFYSIIVSSDDVSKARTLLVQHNLPRRKQLGLTGVYKEKGLIPTPDEQKARFLLAIKGEIINSLSRIPDIIDSDVVLNVPSVDEFADPETRKMKRPTASVVIKAKQAAVVNQTVTEAKVQQFVANAVESLNPRDVTVIISYLPTPKPSVRPGDVVSLPKPTPSTVPGVSAPIPDTSHTLIGLALDADSKARLKVYLLVFFVILMVLSAALILAILQGIRMRRKVQELGGEGQPAVEGQVLEEGPPRLGAGAYEERAHEAPESVGAPPEMEDEGVSEDYDYGEEEEER
jgi:type III secretion system YscJ/HrcJ family lipoprotein